MTFVEGCATNDDDRSGFDDAVAAAASADVAVLVMGDRAGLDRGVHVRREPRRVVARPARRAGGTGARRRRHRHARRARARGRAPDRVARGARRRRRRGDRLVPGRAGRGGDRRRPGRRRQPGRPATGQLSAQLGPDPGLLRAQGVGRPVPLEGPLRRSLERAAVPVRTRPRILDVRARRRGRSTARSVTVDDVVEVAVTVTNTGGREADEVVQLYTCDPVASVTRPVRELQAFRRLTLAAGAAARVTFHAAGRRPRFHRLRPALRRRGRGHRALRRHVGRRRPAGGACRRGGDGVAIAAPAGRQRVVGGVALNQPAGANWAGNVTFAATGVARPRTVTEVQEVVADAARRGERVHAVGARHSFTRGGRHRRSADRHRRAPRGGRPRRDRGDGDRRRRHPLRRAGAVPRRARWALVNLPSLPHVSVAGAVATATHGSGDSNPVLADAVRAVDLVTSPGDRRRLERGDPDAAAAIVGLGAFGVRHPRHPGPRAALRRRPGRVRRRALRGRARPPGRPARVGLQREPVHRLVDGNVPPGLAQASDDRRPGRGRGRRPDRGAPAGASDPRPAARRLHHPARPARPVARAVGALPRRRHAERR